MGQQRDRLTISTAGATPAIVAWHKAAHSIRMARDCHPRRARTASCLVGTPSAAWERDAIASVYWRTQIEMSGHGSDESLPHLRRFESSITRVCSLRMRSSRTYSAGDDGPEMPLISYAEEWFGLKAALGPNNCRDRYSSPHDDRTGDNQSCPHYN